MAVIVEATSVILRIDRIRETYPGGWEAFAHDSPNTTLCADDEIVRIGFMTPVDVEAFLGKLAQRGFVYARDGKAVDLVVVDQIHGLLMECDWLEFGRIDFDGNRVAACRLKGSQIPSLYTPDGWKFETSLSASYGFVPNESIERSLIFLRRKGSVDVFLNTLTNQEVYVGRTGQTPDRTLPSQNIHLAVFTRAYCQCRESRYR